MRAEDAQGTPTQSHLSRSILVYEESIRESFFHILKNGNCRIPSRYGLATAVAGPSHFRCRPRPGTHPARLVRCIGPGRGRDSPSSQDETTQNDSNVLTSKPRPNYAFDYLIYSLFARHRLWELSAASSRMYVVPCSELPIVSSYPHICSAMDGVPHRPILPSYV